MFFVYCSQKNKWTVFVSKILSKNLKYENVISVALESTGIEIVA